MSKQTKAMVKRLSDALLKVRPLGGSELFIAYGDGYVADPVHCGMLIDKLRNDNVEFCKERILSQRLLGDLVEALKAHDAYMSEKFSEGPDSTALHPDAAANWKRVRAALLKADGASS